MKVPLDLDVLGTKPSMQSFSWQIISQILSYIVVKCSKTIFGYETELLQYSKIEYQIVYLIG